MQKGIKKFSYEDHDFSEVRPVVICARWNEEFTSQMLSSALEEFSLAGTQEPEVIFVPGSYELAQACSRVLDRSCPSLVCVLGCIIEGETTHNQFLSDHMAASFAKLSIEATCPVSMGVLTCRNASQVEARLDKGSEVAAASLEMLATGLFAN